MQLQKLHERAGRIRLIASDLDGTLFKEASIITDRTVRAVRALEKRNISFVVCTGREYSVMGWLVDKLQLTAPLICKNGAEIVDPIKGTLYNKCMSPQACYNLVCICMKNGVDLCLTTADAVYVPNGSQLVKFYLQHSAMTGEGHVKPPAMFPLDTAKQALALAVNKIILSTSEPGYSFARDYLQRCPDLTVTSSSPVVVDVISAGVNKGDGLRRVAEHLGVSLDECCAFGDFHSDLPMFSCCGLSFAMGNAEENARNAADFIAPSNVDDGVAVMIEKLFLGD